MRKNIVIISGASAVGKGALIEELVQTYNWQAMRSITDRPKREEELIKGSLYKHVSTEEFQELKHNGELLEYNQPYGTDWYGLEKQPVVDAIERGYIAVKDIDVKGYIQVMQSDYKKHIYGVFLQAPSIETLRERMRKRGVLPKDVEERRLKRAVEEEKEAYRYDMMLISEDGKIPQIARTIYTRIV